MGDKIINIKEIMQTIPHRYPFLLVDTVIDFEEGKWIEAVKNVTINEPFFQGHFPQEPIMPGVLMIEALAQTGGILALQDGKNKGKLAFFMTIDKAKFRKPVTPGDQLILRAEHVRTIRDTIVQIYGKATVEGKCVAEAELKFSLVDKEKLK